MPGRLRCFFSMLQKYGGDDFCHLRRPCRIRVDLIWEEVCTIQKGVVQVDDGCTCEAGNFFDLRQNLIFDKGSVDTVPEPDEGGNRVHQPHRWLAGQIFELTDQEPRRTTVVMVKVLPLFVFSALTVIGAELDEDDVWLVGEGVLILLGINPCRGGLRNHRASADPEVLHLKAVSKEFL